MGWYLASSLELYAGGAVAWFGHGDYWSSSVFRARGSRNSRHPLCASNADSTHSGCLYDRHCFQARSSQTAGFGVTLGPVVNGSTQNVGQAAKLALRLDRRMKIETWLHKTEKTKL